MSAEIYIFNADAMELFYEKIEDLHEKHVYRPLLSGVAPNGTDLESIKMSKNPNSQKKYYERVVGGLVNTFPQIIVRLVEDKAIKLECIFTEIDDKEYVKGLYMIQNVIDWPSLGTFTCQVWDLKDTTVDQVRKIWN